MRIASITFWVVKKDCEGGRYFAWNVGWNNYVCFDRLPQYGGNQKKYQGYHNLISNLLIEIYLELKLFYE